MNKDINYQYAYTTEEAISLAISKKCVPKNSILVKNGQTIEQTVNNRLKQQDNASSTSKPILICSQKIEHNTDIKLDDKIRDYICYKGSSLIFQDYIRDDNKHNEWTIVNVEKILKKLKIKLSTDVAHNKEFMSILAEEITKAKTEAVKNLLDKDLLCNIELRAWQEYVFQNVKKADKKYNLLSLSPRFGKTFLILELVKDYVKKTGQEVLLVPVSKNKSSNTSFENDYDTGSYGKGEYSFSLAKSSLFEDDNTILDKLSKGIKKDTVLILVTDEADLASHTSISKQKIDNIKEKFNVVKYFAMSGTGIYKAAKIFSDIPEEDIHIETMNYTEMTSFNKPIVKRNFLNVFLDISKFNESKNIRQSIKDPIDHDDMAKYLDNFISDSTYAKRANLKALNCNDAVMIFIDANNKSQLKRFINHFNSMYKDTYNCLTITGDDTTNARAERDTKRCIRKMKQERDHRTLVIFSNGMASRSYSIPEIKRVIVMRDGVFSSNDYQKFSRALTLTENKNTADIIRISFSDMNLDSEIFMIENETISNTPQTKEIVTKFITNNSFSKMIIGKDGGIVFTELKKESDSDNYILDFIDKTMKFTDTTKYLVTKLFDSGIEIDATATKISKSITKVIDDSSEHNKISTKSKKSKQEVHDDQLALEKYIDIMRSMPYVCICFKISDIEEMFKLGKNEWRNYWVIDKSTFIKNYKNIEPFRNVLNSLFRNSLNYNAEYAQEKVDEYLSSF